MLLEVSRSISNVVILTNAKNVLNVRPVTMVTDVLTYVFTAKGRTNFDLRDTLSPDGQTTFRPRKGSGTFGYKSKLNDTGYASSISSGTSQSENLSPLSLCFCRRTLDSKPTATSYQ